MPVVAKPAEQTPLIAAAAVCILHDAGVPGDALHLVTGDGQIGAALVADANTAGVAFTGSTSVAWAINRALAAKDAPIVPLIAETGGNQRHDRGFDRAARAGDRRRDRLGVPLSAGQRCSALRLLCLQDDIARQSADDDCRRRCPNCKSAIRAIPATQIGPVIDADAKLALDARMARMEAAGRVRFRRGGGQALPAAGHYVAPAIVTLDRAEDLHEEVVRPDPPCGALARGANCRR